MTFELGDLTDILDGLHQLGGCILPPKLSYAISYNTSKIAQEEAIFRKEREKLINRFAKRTKEGNPIVEEQPDGKQKYILEDGRQFNIEYDELCGNEINIDIRKVPFSLIEEAAEVDRYTTLSIDHYNAMSFMIEDDDEPAEPPEPEKNA